MWLPKDERKLLVIYYVAIKEGLKKDDLTPIAEKWYSMDRLILVFRSRDYKADEKQFQEGDNKEADGNTLVKKMDDFLTGMAVIDATNAALAERELIKLSPHKQEPTRVGVSLTMKGYDLGRKYLHWYTQIGPFLQEYGWVGPVVGVVVGIIGTLIVQLIVEWLK